MRVWSTHRWTVVAAVTLAAALAMGVPTGIVRTDFYHRMTPVQWWNYPVWGLSAVLIGLLAGTYVARAATSSAGAPLTGGFLSTLAVGCPICNKLVVGAIGISGALNVWAPIQPWIGAASVLMLGYVLRRRLSGERACPAPRRPVV